MRPLWTRDAGEGHKAEEPPDIWNTEICCSFLELDAILLTGRLHSGSVRRCCINFAIILGGPTTGYIRH